MIIMAREAHWVSLSPFLLIAVPLFSACGGGDSPPGEPPTQVPASAVGSPEVTPTTPGSSRTSTPQTGSIVVSGFFVQVFGDPPPGSNGEPRYSHTLTTPAAEEWRLMFDADVYLPTNGIEAYNLKQVVVEGVVLPDGQILVERMELQ